MQAECMQGGSQGGWHITALNTQPQSATYAPACRPPILSSLSFPLLPLLSFLSSLPVPASPSRSVPLLPSPPPPTQHASAFAPPTGAGADSRHQHPGGL